VSWQLAERGTGVIDVTVPPGTEAELALPDGTTDRLAPGTHRRRWLGG
jgi:hypothetical protein